MTAAREPTAADWRAALALVACASLPLDVRSRLQPALRRAADAAGPRPLYSLEPVGFAWRIGIVGSTAIHTPPPQGLDGLAFAQAAISTPGRFLGRPTHREARRLRSQLARAAAWVQDECQCEPVADAIRAIEVSTRRGIRFVDPGHILIAKP